MAWQQLRLRNDVIGTSDGFAKSPYIRESRRIKAEFTVVEQHVGTDARAQVMKVPRENLTAESFADIGRHRLISH